MRTLWGSLFRDFAARSPLRGLSAHGDPHQGSTLPIHGPPRARRFIGHDRFKNRSATLERLLPQCRVAPGFRTEGCPCGSRSKRGAEHRRRPRPNGRGLGTGFVRSARHSLERRISLAEQPSGDWAAEIAAGPGFGPPRLTGYFANDWYQESHTVARIAQSSGAGAGAVAAAAAAGGDQSQDQGTTTLKLLEYSRYGITEQMGGATAPGRFRAYGLLCEVDSPGEYWYDHAAQLLYLYPLPDTDTNADAATSTSTATASASAVRLGVPSAGAFLSLIDSEWVTLRGVAQDQRRRHRW